MIHAGVPAVALAAAAVLGGCNVFRVAQATPDTLATWSDRPLAPDPKLTAIAMDPNSACQAGPGTQVVLQDRRTALSAGFLLTSPTRFATCLVTAAGGGSSGGSGPLFGAMTGRISIDDNGHGGLGEARVRELGGRVVLTARQVIVHLSDGRLVHASVGNGYWLAWWPDTATAEQVVGLDAAGAVVASSEVVGD